VHHRREDLDHVELDRQGRQIGRDVLGADLLGRRALDDEALAMDVWSEIAHELVSPVVPCGSETGP
jgi:hypothetical protein